MNVLTNNNGQFKYEMFWRYRKNKQILDADGNTFPWPEHNNHPWPDKDQFLDKYKTVLLDVTKSFDKYNKSLDCILCGKKMVSTGTYMSNNIVWDNSLKHYVSKHNIKPSDEFIDFIYRYNPKKSKKSRIVARINGISMIKHDKKYLKVDRNQILIMDALMMHGSYKIYTDDQKKFVYRYSEHAGLLDFGDNGLDKIIIFGNTTRVDNNDNDIFLPKNMPDAIDYEYMFHTHPPTPKAGARAKAGVLYEFPSISDIFHFLDHYNEGKTQGSIIIAPEGMYIIRKLNQNDKDIKIDENKFYKEISNIYADVQRTAIKKYGVDFDLNTFYSKIAQDRTYLDQINKVLNKYHMNIDYYPRVKDVKNKWVIDTIYLPVYVIEPVSK